MQTLTFLEAARAMPSLTAFVGCFTGLIILVLIGWNLHNYARYLKFQRALKLDKEYVRFWVEASVCDIHDEAGGFMYTKRALELYMQVQDQLRVRVVTEEGPMKSYIAEVVEHGFVVKGAPASLLPLQASPVASA